MIENVEMYPVESLYIDSGKQSMLQMSSFPSLLQFMGRSEHAFYCS